MSDLAKAYVIAEIDVHDAADYENYKAAAAPMIERFGGRYLVRGGPADSIEGTEPRGRLILLEFADVAAARRFLDSEDYRAVAAIRHRSATSRLTLVEGVAS